MPRLKLTLAYDGGAYAGWQIQANAPSVQATVEAALNRLLGVRTKVLVAGRTDAGVHATGQVIAFDTDADLPLRAYHRGLNGILPSDIAIVAAEVAARDFDPRRWARSRRYRYCIVCAGHRVPLLRRTHWEIFESLDTTAMARAASCLVGSHDFSAFRASDCEAATAVRELYKVQLLAGEDARIELLFEGSAFLKHMVRTMVGSLVEVGRGRRHSDWMRRVLESQDRRQAGPTAPAHGLVLEAVSYGSAVPEAVRLPELDSGTG